MADLTATVRERGDVAVIALAGDLDVNAEPELTGAYARAAGTAPRIVVLNFSEVGYINSTGIALIVAVLAEARRTGVEIRVAGLTEHYRHIFEITRLADFMTFFDSEAEAADTTTAQA